MSRALATAGKGAKLLGDGDAILVLGQYLRNAKNSGEPTDCPLEQAKGGTYKLRDAETGQSGEPERQMIWKDVNQNTHAAKKRKTWILRSTAALITRLLGVAESSGSMISFRRQI